MPDWLSRRAASDDGVVEIAQADAEAVALFMALDTQWRMHPMSGQRLGIDYAAIKPAAELFGLSLTTDTASALRAMEMAALAEFAKGARR